MRNGIYVCGRHSPFRSTKRIVNIPGLSSTSTAMGLGTMKFASPNWEKVPLRALKGGRPGDAVIRHALNGSNLFFPIWTCRCY
jgi:hypothetical protein